MKKKHKRQQTDLQKLTELFKEFNRVYNDNFFLLNINQPKNKK